MMRQWLWSEIGEVIILIKTITHALSFSPVKKNSLSAWLHKYYAPKLSFCPQDQIIICSDHFT